MKDVGRRTQRVNHQPLGPAAWTVLMQVFSGCIEWKPRDKSQGVFCGGICVLVKGTLRGKT